MQPRIGCTEAADFCSLTHQVVGTIHRRQSMLGNRGRRTKKEIPMKSENSGEVPPESPCHPSGLSQPFPRIIAIETSSRHGSIASAQGSQLLQTLVLPAGNRHATELMPAMKTLTESAGWKPGEIDHLYLSLGPGSFTGLRIAIAIARAMHQAIGCKLVGVPSLDVIAENAPSGFSFVVPLLDAKRAQVFAARYERRGETGQLVRIAEAALVDPAAFVAETVALAGDRGVAILGEGVEYHRGALATVSGGTLTQLESALWAPRAEVVHRLGYAMAGRGEFVDPQTLLPTYIRLPEAEEVWRKKHNVPLG
jgi:tRNA threonylcarbamoyladenosine biosynthesis protein TsaB